MKIDDTTLKAAFNLAANRTKKRYLEGRLPQWIDAKGLLALMADKIARYYENGGHDEILDLAVDSLSALALLIAGGKQDSKVDVDEDRSIAEEIAAEEVPRDREINPNAVVEGEEDDSRWKADGAGVRLTI